jgi:hypothetical protein
LPAEAPAEQPGNGAGLHGGGLLADDLVIRPDVLARGGRDPLESQCTQRAGERVARFPQRLVREDVGGALPEGGRNFDPAHGVRKERRIPGEPRFKVSATVPQLLQGKRFLERRLGGVAGGQEIGHELEPERQRSGPPGGCNEVGFGCHRGGGRGARPGCATFGELR